MSELKDDLKKVDFENGQTIVESISDGRAAQGDPPEVLLKVVNEVKPLVIKAMPYRQYYVVRLVRLLYVFAFSLTLTFLICFLGRTIDGCEKFFDLAWAYLWPTIALLMEFASSLGYVALPASAVFVTDAQGRKISPWRAFWRSLVWLATVLIFPLHILLIATGNRRFMHDILSGTYVREPGEDPAKTFYPPIPRYWSVLLVVVCVGILSHPFAIENKIRKLAFVAMPYKTSDISWDRNGGFTQVAALSADLKRSTFGANHIETAKALLLLAFVSMREENKSVFWDAIEKISQLPDGVVMKAQKELEGSTG